MSESPRLLERLAQSPSHQARLLPQLLPLLHWPGQEIQLRNALCGAPDAMDGTDLLNTLANLGYRWDVARLSVARPGDWSQAALPLLLRGLEPGAPLQLAQTPEQLAQLLAQQQGQGLAYSLHFEPVRAGETRQWFQAQVLRFRRGIGELYVISLLINLLALVLPFFIRAVYNLEIPGGQVGDLFLLLPFALIAVALQIWLSQWRQTRLAAIGGRLELLLATRVLDRWMRLPLPQLERYTPLALESRFGGYQSLRAYLTGPLALAALDLPFIGIYLVAIASMSVPLMGLTIAMVVACFGGLWAIGAVGRSLQRSLSRNPSNLEPLLLDLVQNLDQIKASGSERLWQRRLETASLEQAGQGIGPVRLQQLIAILTGEFSQLTGALVLAVGTGLALAGAGLELGTLIAAMFFVWRVFRPIQMGYQAFSRWPQMQPILQQLNRFMANAEVEPDSAISRRWLLPPPKGAITFKTVTLRLNTLLDPALAQLSLQIAPGELVVISGAEGAGSSSLLRLIDGQLAPGSGSVSLDGADLRQYPLSQLRQAVAYLPENAGVFPGTLRENLLLADPLRSDPDLEAILQTLGLGELLEAPGLDRQLDRRGPRSLLPHQVQGIALARVLLRDAAVLLLDQPFSRLTPATTEALLLVLRQRRGVATTLVAVDAPELLQIADRIVILKDGSVAFSGTPAELLATQQQAQAARARTPG